MKRISPDKSSSSENLTLTLDTVAGGGRGREEPEPKWTFAVKYELVTFSVQNYTESTDKSQNIVEQANSNPNNTSLTMSRRHIICNSSILTEWTSSLTPNKIRTYSKVEVEKYNEPEESQILAVFPT